MLANIKYFVVFLAFVGWISACAGKITKSTPSETEKNPTNTVETHPELKEPLLTGADQWEAYLPMIQNERIALVVNQTSRVGGSHIVDFLTQKGVKIQCIFAPEHGFRGDADAGATIKNGMDVRTGIQVYSLYGASKKPSAAQLAQVDRVIFDIQDVGARFYTYISSMHYVMEACAEQSVPVLVLDRPNPNGHYVDGPTLEPAYSSFVGMHPVPVVHGMTIAEYARMVKSLYLPKGLTCDLSWIACKGYTHQTPYDLPERPSPNLPNLRSIYLYPSLCFFEGTVVSVGRGTDKQFQVIGAPAFAKYDYTFTPKPMLGAQDPPHKGQVCKGLDLSNLDTNDLFQSASLNIQYLIDFYKNSPDKSVFFNKNLFFDKLAGTDQLRKQIIAGTSEAEIRASWQADLAAFKKMRRGFLLYEE